jgi:hypothetical protein
MAIEPHDFVTELAKKLLDRRGELVSEEPEAVANQLAGNPDLDELMSFAGFLGGIVKNGEREWRLLYLDTCLQTWLLVEENDIVYNTTVEDDTAPAKKRDVIWVRADASVGRGSGAQSAEARFLTGEFTKAGDFEARPTGGTMAAATGVFCEARTPFCCYGRSR